MLFEEEINNEIPPYLDGLNEPQMQAVLQIDGPIMIIAGAGSGKTRVLTYRLVHMINRGIDPFSILSLTFTNKAAREMRNRIEKVSGSAARNLWMGTFHSIFARILRYEADRIGYPKTFTIYDTEDSKSLLKSIIKERNLDDKIYKPSMVLNRISAAKTNLLGPQEYKHDQNLIMQDRNANRPKFAEIYETYADRCFKSGAMDFDDILLNTYKLFRDIPDVCLKWQHKFKYIMVDEYQDTNHLQYLITRKLAAAYQNICVVGDDAQSIYAFRGADIKNILNFNSDYPEAKTFKLEQNYRSTQNIVAAAGSVIRHNKNQLKKEVWTDNELGDRIKVVRCITDAEEARFVAQNIFEVKNNEHLPNHAFTILYRTNSQSRTFEEALRRLNIDYKIYGGTSFYQRKEIKDVIAYLRLTVNPSDEEAMKRIINYPTRGIGTTTIEKIAALADENKFSLWQIVSKSDEFAQLGAAIPKLKKFYLMIKDFQSKLADTNAFDLATYIVKQTTLLGTLYEDKTAEGVSRYENVVELLNGIKEFTDDDENAEEKSLANFLELVALYTDDDSKNKNADRDCVSLMTIHASKGLEFPHVYLVGLEENLFPSQLALQSRAELEEERRLFYVAITRAEKKLTFTFANSRIKYGNITPSEPSRFINDVDKNYVDMELGNKNKPTPFGNSTERTTPTMKLFEKPKTISTQITIDPNFVPSELHSLKEGDEVLHQRFGKGQVLQLEGEADNKKAHIYFEQINEQKTLVLKFAKMKIM